MTQPYNLLLSPHPDDLIFSAFSTLCEPTTPKLIVEFFNVSKFTKWRIFPAPIATSLRTAEEIVILASLRLRAKFLFQADTTAAKVPGAVRVNLTSAAKLVQRPANIFSPLGVGRHADHLAVRDSALEYWNACKREPALLFYEDLPYAARDLSDELSTDKTVQQLSEVLSPMSVVHNRLSSSEMKRKLFYASSYLTQTDYRKLLENHARKVGSEAGGQFAERLFSPQ